MNMNADTGDKYKWLRRVMASELTPATKLFAWAVFDHMYSDKTVSNPGGERISSATGLAGRRFKDYRNALFQSGAMSGQLVKTDSGDWDSYEYRLNLAWDGVTSNVGTPEKSGPDEKSPRVGTTSREGHDEKSGRVGTTSPIKRITQAKEEAKKANVEVDAPVVADAPTVTSDDAIREAKNKYAYIVRDSGSPLNLENAEAPVYFLNLEGVTGPVHLLTKKRAPALKVIGGSQKVDGQDWLETLILRNHLHPENAEHARRLFNDPLWRPDNLGVSRAAAAAMYAAEPVAR